MIHKVTFHCPVYNEACKDCDNRFRCWTSKRNYELWLDKYGTCLLHLNIPLGRNCFVVKPDSGLWIMLTNWHDGGVDINIKDKTYRR